MQVVCRRTGKFLGIPGKISLPIMLSGTSLNSVFGKMADKKIRRIVTILKSASFLM
jgi:hypothetical protein